MLLSVLFVYAFDFFLFLFLLRWSLSGILSVDQAGLKVTEICLASRELGLRACATTALSLFCFERQGPTITIQMLGLKVCEIDMCHHSQQ